MDVAMIGLMRDGMLRVKYAAGLRWRAVERLDDGTCRLTRGAGDAVPVRVLSPTRCGGCTQCEGTQLTTTASWG